MQFQLPLTVKIRGAGSANHRGECLKRFYRVLLNFTSYLYYIGRDVDIVHGKTFKQANGKLHGKLKQNMQMG